MLYLLRPRLHGQEAFGAWKPPYDKVFGFVINAVSEAQARKIADKEGGDENRHGDAPWLDPSQSTCIELGTIQKTGVIIMDSNAG